MIVALAALAVSVSTPVFAPPVDYPLRFRTAQTARNHVHYEAIEEVRFAVEPGGYQMTITPLTSGTTAQGHSAREFDIVDHAFDGISAHYHLSAGGTVLRVDDVDTLWAAVLGSIDRWIAARAGTGSNARSLAPIRAFRAAMAATPPADREATLRDNAEALLAPPLPAGETPLAYQDMVSDAAGNPVAVNGQLRRVSGDAAAIRFSAGADSAAAGGASAARVHEARELVVSAADGLLISARRTVSRAGDPIPLIDEHLERIEH